MKVDLAREADFRLGGLDVRPSRREVVAGPERSILEPRVMQVLVALVRRRGEVVSRDELIARCWDGRIVGDDAINACVAKVRRVGEAAEAFAIETVPRVGYRLTASSASPEAVADEMLLAVLPFENLSGDPELAYFSDGVSEEILNTLAQRAGLKIIGRSSSFQLRGADKAAPNVARLLGATHVLDGAVRRSADRIRISAQLIDCRTQISLWADRVEGAPADGLELQDNIAAAVAEALSVALAPRSRRGPVDADAYDLFLRGRTLPTQVTPSDVRSKVVLLEATVARAPEFAEGWGRLGFARASLAYLLPGPEAEAARSAARSAAERALVLDPKCAAAAVAMAHTSPMFGAFLERGRWLQNAVTWGANDSFTLSIYAIFVASVGRCRESVTLLRRSVALDPLNVGAHNSLGSALRESGALDESEAVFSRALERWPEFGGPAIGLIFTLGFKREFARAQVALERYDLGPHRRGIEWFLQLMEDGSPSAAARAVAVLQRQYEKTGRIGVDGLMLAGHLGGADEALGLALRAELGPAQDGADPRGTDAFNPPVLFMVCMPEIRRDPQFVTLCARLGLVDYWLTTNRWPDCVEEVAPYYDFKAECRRVAAASTSAPPGAPQ